MRFRLPRAVAVASLLTVPVLTFATEPLPGPPLTIQRAAGPIVVDGDLSDAGWQGVPGVKTWFETNVGDNVEPQVGNEGFLAYDGKYLYAAFHFLDPEPGRIRAPLADRDQLSGSTDYGGVIIDSSNDGKTAILFLVTVRPDNHLELRGNASARWLNVDDAALGSGRLFLAQVERLRATYSFNARSFVRLIGQYVETTRDVSLYTFPVEEKDAAFGLSALFAYKLNWQTVFYLGYGDDRAYAVSTDDLERNGRQAFAKISYALQK